MLSEFSCEAAWSGTHPLENNLAKNVQPECSQAFAFNFQFTENTKDGETNKTILQGGNQIEKVQHSVGTLT